MDKMYEHSIKELLSHHKSASKFILLMLELLLAYSYIISALDIIFIKLSTRQLANMISFIIFNFFLLCNSFSINLFVFLFDFSFLSIG